MKWLAFKVQYVIMELCKCFTSDFPPDVTKCQSSLIVPYYIPKKYKKDKELTKFSQQI